MLKLEWKGPYSLNSHSEFPSYLAADDAPGFDGLYCWCVLVDGVFLPTYIGKSQGKTVGVISRVRDEIGDSLSGRYMALLDVDEFQAGRRLVLRPRFSDASEKRGDNVHIHAQHLDEYRALVEVSLVFFARTPSPSENSIVPLERSTIARVQNSGLDVLPTHLPDRGHYEALLAHATCKETVQVEHLCEWSIRGLTTLVHPL